MPDPSDTPVVVLCGGRGMRLQERTHAIPKPLVEIGGMPIVWHVVQLYAHAGFRDVVLATGWLGEQVEAFVAQAHWPEDVEVRCVDTGRDTPTGGRVARLADELAAGPFCVTYADGVADVDLRALLAFHDEHDGTATMTVVRPPLPFGVAQLAGDRVTGFVEKPPSREWVNGGFLVLDPEALEAIGPDDVLEREPLEALARRGHLRAFRHDGFWDCMDTNKDAILLNDLWSRQAAPWKVWA